MRRGSSRYRGGEEISSRAELDRESLPRKRSAGFHQLGIIVDGWHRGCRLTSSRLHRDQDEGETRCKPRFAFGNNVRTRTRSGLPLVFPRVEKRDPTTSPSLARICETLQLIPPVLAHSLYYWTIHGGLQIAHGLSSSRGRASPLSGERNKFCWTVSVCEIPVLVP